MKHKLISLVTRYSLDYLWTWGGLEYKSNKRITWSLSIMSFLDTKETLNSKAFFDFMFRIVISILHLDNLLGIIFGQFKFLIDLEFGNDEWFWFFGLMNHHWFWREVKMHCIWDLILVWVFIFKHWHLLMVLQGLEVLIISINVWLTYASWSPSGSWFLTNNAIGCYKGNWFPKIQ